MPSNTYERRRRLPQVEVGGDGPRRAFWSRARLVCTNSVRHILPQLKLDGWVLPHVRRRLRTVHWTNMANRFPPIPPRQSIPAKLNRARGAAARTPTQALGATLIWALRPLHTAYHQLQLPGPMARRNQRLRHLGEARRTRIH